MSVFRRVSCRGNEAAARCPFRCCLNISIHGVILYAIYKYNTKMTSRVAAIILPPIIAERLVPFHFFVKGSEVANACRGCVFREGQMK